MHVHVCVNVNVYVHVRVRVHIHVQLYVDAHVLCYGVQCVHINFNTHDHVCSGVHVPKLVHGHDRERVCGVICVVDPFMLILSVIFKLSCFLVIPCDLTLWIFLCFMSGLISVVSVTCSNMLRAQGCAFSPDHGGVIV